MTPATPRCVVVIPARLESTRFPGKILASETGKPLIQHVYEQAMLASGVDEVIIAAADQAIVDAAHSFGAAACLTDPHHPNGTSRIAEAISASPAEIVVNVQGDEPEIDPAAIDAVIDALGRDPEAPMASIAAPFASGDEIATQTIVKVAVTADRRARAFSRMPIPEVDGDLPGPLKHLGLYAYRTPFLQEYLAMEPTPAEIQERLEQLRVLDHGIPIAMAVIESAHTGIDTPQEYAAFVARYRSS